MITTISSNKQQWWFNTTSMINHHQVCNQAVRPLSLDLVLNHQHYCIYSYIVRVAVGDQNNHHKCPQLDSHRRKPRPIFASLVISLQILGFFITTDLTLRNTGVIQCKTGVVSWNSHVYFGVCSSWPNGTDALDGRNPWWTMRTAVLRRWVRTDLAAGDTSHTVTSLKDLHWHENQKATIHFSQLHLCESSTWICLPAQRHPTTPCYLQTLHLKNPSCRHHTTNPCSLHECKRESLQLRDDHGFQGCDYLQTYGKIALYSTNGAQL